MLTLPQELFVGLTGWDLNLNWAKVVSLGVIWAVALKVHIQKHFLDKGEHRERFFLGSWAYALPYLLTWGVCCSVGIAYVRGQRPLNGPWKWDEVMALAIAYFGFFLRFWAQESLKEFFTYSVGIRQGHK